MNALELIKTRRSVRNFTKEKVGDEDLKLILEAGRWAPSGLNNQPWRFIVITDSEIKEKVVQQTHYSDTIRNAPLAIAVFLDTKSSYDRTKDVQAVGACIQNMLLAAHSLRYGGCWIGEILKKKEEVQKILEAPKEYELMAVLAIGHPKNNPEESERKTLDELVTKRWT